MTETDDCDVSLNNILPIRIAFNLLMWGEIRTLRDLINTTEKDLLKIKLIGKEKVKTIKKRLAILDLKLK